MEWNGLCLSRRGVLSKVSKVSNAYLAHFVQISIESLFEKKKKRKKIQSS